MSRRGNCSKCGRPNASGEPPLCDKCFDEEFRHDPACIGQPGFEYCGGAESGCRYCIRQEKKTKIKISNKP